MLEAEAEIRAKGAQLVVIGNGPVDSLDDFAKSYPETVVFLTDPQKKAYQALSLLRGMGGMQSLSMIGSGFRAFRAGHRQSKTKGDPLQQGGVFVVGQGGAVLYEQRSKTAGDHANVSEVLESLETHSWG